MRRGAGQARGITYSNENSLATLFAVGSNIIDWATLQGDGGEKAVMN